MAPKSCEPRKHDGLASHGKFHHKRSCVSLKSTLCNGLLCNSGESTTMSVRTSKMRGGATPPRVRQTPPRRSGSPTPVPILALSHMGTPKSGQSRPTLVKLEVETWPNPPQIWSEDAKKDFAPYAERRRSKRTASCVRICGRIMCVKDMPRKAMHTPSFGASDGTPKNMCDKRFAATMSEKNITSASRSGTELAMEYPPFRISLTTPGN